MMARQARPSAKIMALDTHMILEAAPAPRSICPNGHQAINRTSRHYADALREERLQVKRHRPQRVRPRPARHELQITVHQPVAQRIPDLTGPRHGADKTREAAHRSTLPPPGRIHPYASDITHVLGVRQRTDAAVTGESTHSQRRLPSS